MPLGNPEHKPLGITTTRIATDGPFATGTVNLPAGSSPCPPTPLALARDRVKQLETELATARREIAKRRKQEEGEEVELIDLYLCRLAGGSLHVYAPRGRRLLTNALLDYRRHLTEGEEEPSAAFRVKVDKMVGESLRLANGG